MKEDECLQAVPRHNCAPYLPIHRPISSYPSLLAGSYVFSLIPEHDEISGSSLLLRAPDVVEVSSWLYESLQGIIPVWHSQN